GVGQSRISMIPEGPSDSGKMAWPRLTCPHLLLGILDEHISSQRTSLNTTRTVQYHRPLVIAENWVTEPVAQSRLVRQQCSKHYKRHGCSGGRVSAYGSIISAPLQCGG